jgi:hypothetical protein
VTARRAIERAEAAGPPPTTILAGRMGRPPVPPEERRTHRLMVRLSDAELSDLRAWAERQGVAVAEAVRDAALRAARWRP